MSTFMLRNEIEELRAELAAAKAALQEQKDLVAELDRNTVKLTEENKRIRALTNDFAVCVGEGIQKLQVEDEKDGVLLGAVRTRVLLLERTLRKIRHLCDSYPEGKMELAPILKFAETNLGIIPEVCNG